MKKVLGFDISTTCIGISVFEYDDSGKWNFVKVQSIKPDKKISLFARLKKTKDEILNIIKENNPDEIVIENIIEFMNGKSSSKTIIALAVMNRMIGLAVYEYLQKEPHLLHVSTIRATIKPEDYSGRILDKKDIPLVLENTYGIKYEWTYKKRSGKIADETYDQADSIAVALAWIMKNFVEKKPVKRKKR